MTYGACERSGVHAKQQRGYAVGLDRLNHTHCSGVQIRAIMSDIIKVPATLA